MSINPPSLAGRQSRASGVTLMELLMAIGVMSMLGVVILILAVSTGRSFAEMVNYVDLDHYNRVALDMMTRDIRQVQYLKSFSSNSMTFIDKDGQPLQYDYSSTAKAMVRIKGGQKKVLLDNCDQMQFAIFQRTPISNRFDLYPVTSVTNTKVVRVTWNCSRTLFGRRVNSEQAQAARIVIRNKKEL
jgi:hypothetical protein